MLIANSGSSGHLTNTKIISFIHLYETYYFSEAIGRSVSRVQPLVVLIYPSRIIIHNFKILCFQFPNILLFALNIVYILARIDIYIIGNIFLYDKRYKQNGSRIFIIMYSSKVSPLSIFSQGNFNMSPILQTLKTSGSCFWCREMNFISIFDSFRASRVHPSHLLLLFPIYLDSLSLYAKHSRSHNFTKNIENTSKFHENPSDLAISERQKKKENNVSCWKLLWLC